MEVQFKKSRCKVSVAENTFERFVPSAEERWDRNGANIVNGVPYHDLEIVGNPTEYPVRPLYIRNRFSRQRIGERILLGYSLSDGSDRLAVVRTLDDAHRSDANLLVTTSTAWTTRPDTGYVAGRDDSITKDIGIQTATIGASGSTNQRFVSPLAMGGVSLAKDAQSEQLILQDVSKRLSLPTLHYGLGDSMGAMKKPGHAIYAPMYGNDILYTDIKAPCVPDKLTIEDMPKVALWFGIEALGSTAVMTSLLREGRLGSLAGTFDIHPYSLAHSFAGILPALMSGEAGALATLAPNNINGHVVLYGHDILSSVHRWHQIYADKPGVTLKDVPRGSHAHLLQRVELQLNRIERTRDEMLSHKHLTEDIDWEFVETAKRAKDKKEAFLRLVAN